ncbi:unnamed protein product [Timema podura]|uniref:Uncharacterized protein n=1 Tax=Timema podura TaxID=61482 RepID=A0ABN7NH00_TIMPD|nr:unnamed protein product [Timema podura]
MLHSSPKLGMLNLFQEHAKLCECVRTAHTPERTGSLNGDRGKVTPRLIVVQYLLLSGSNHPVPPSPPAPHILEIKHTKITILFNPLRRAGLRGEHLHLNTIRGDIRRMQLSQLPPSALHESSSRRRSGPHPRSLRHASPTALFDNGKLLTSSNIKLHRQLPAWSSPHVYVLKLSALRRVLPCVVCEQDGASLGNLGQAADTRPQARLEDHLGTKKTHTRTCMLVNHVP